MDTRLGIFGGTFDPPHRAHLAAARVVVDACGLDRLLLMVAADPWQKRGRVVATAADRLAMVEAAVGEDEHLVASDLEIKRGGPTYTADTIEELRGAAAELFLVIGADLVAELPTWKRVEVLRTQCTLVIMNRGDVVAAPPPGWACRSVTVPAFDDSSRVIRARLAAGQSVDDVVPAPVRALITERGLYTSRR